MTTDKFIRRIDAPFGSEDIGCSPDGDLVFFSTLSTSKDLSIVDTQTDTILQRITLNYPPSGFIFSPTNPSLIYVRHLKCLLCKWILCNG